MSVFVFLGNAVVAVVDVGIGDVVGVAGIAAAAAAAAVI